MKHVTISIVLLLLTSTTNAQNRKQPELFEVPAIQSSWDDLTDGIKTREDWEKRQEILRQGYFDLIRDEFKPEKPPLDLKVHEDVEVEGKLVKLEKSKSK